MNDHGDDFIHECDHPRAGWYPEEHGADHMACILPEFHEGPHRNIAGYTWGDSPALPNVGRLLFGLVNETQWKSIGRLDGVFRLPNSDIILVSPTGLIRMMGQGAGQTRWYGGRMELIIDGALLVLWEM